MSLTISTFHVLWAEKTHCWLFGQLVCCYPISKYIRIISKRNVYIWVKYCTSHKSNDNGIRRNSNNLWVFEIFTKKNCGLCNLEACWFDNELEVFCLFLFCFVFLFKIHHFTSFVLMTCSCCSRTGVTPVNAAALNREPLHGSCHRVIIRCLFIISQGGNVSYYFATLYRTYMRGMRGLLTFCLSADRGGGGIRAESTRLGLLLTRRASLASGSPQAIWDDSVHWQHAIVCFS